MTYYFTITLFLARLVMICLIGNYSSQLERKKTAAFINKANNTHFRPGLIFFTFYTLNGIVSSFMLKKERGHQSP